MNRRQQIIDQMAELQKELDAMPEDNNAFVQTFNTPFLDELKVVSTLLFGNRRAIQILTDGTPTDKKELYGRALFTSLNVETGCIPSGGTYIKFIKP